MNQITGGSATVAQSATWFPNTTGTFTYPAPSVDPQVRIAAALERIAFALEAWPKPVTAVKIRTLKTRKARRKP